MEDLFVQPVRYDAVLQVFKQDFPELQNATVIITDYEEHVLVGVKTVCMVRTKENGGVSARKEQLGDYCKISKNSSLTELFDKVRQMLLSVSEMVEKAKRGEYSQSENEKELGDKA